MNKVTVYTVMLCILCWIVFSGGCIRVAENVEANAALQRDINARLYELTEQYETEERVVDGEVVRVYIIPVEDFVHIRRILNDNARIFDNYYFILIGKPRPDSDSD